MFRVQGLGSKVDHLGPKCLLFGYLDPPSRSQGLGLRSLKMALSSQAGVIVFNVSTLNLKSYTQRHFLEFARFCVGGQFCF